ncbi:hypothetical protein EDEG_01530 [Edhazardia aedis USNM 41457]|uniref:Uncharacterized protein n=1 Tax=Edhazardia aedis (strain USNM 41457) TaxID=1003232 RepID=J9DNR5_EDHAE|nr:hypothetical protein EDEG_01530 [Edhazardia aedis USNM 41457]|eukprot:EJW04180.1 hypothetical protein EDEG_01530 [Edhazardia aedis USNM 41457]
MSDPSEKGLFSNEKSLHSSQKLSDKLVKDFIARVGRSKGDEQSVIEELSRRSSDENSTIFTHESDSTVNYTDNNERQNRHLQSQPASHGKNLTSEQKLSCVIEELKKLQTTGRLFDQRNCQNSNEKPFFFRASDTQNSSQTLFANDVLGELTSYSDRNDVLPVTSSKETDTIHESRGNLPIERNFIKRWDDSAKNNNTTEEPREDIEEIIASQSGSGNSLNRESTVLSVIVDNPKLAKNSETELLKASRSGSGNSLNREPTVLSVIVDNPKLDKNSETELLKASARHKSLETNRKKRLSHVLIKFVNYLLIILLFYFVIEFFFIIFADDNSKQKFLTPYLAGRIMEFVNGDEKRFSQPQCLRTSESEVSSVYVDLKAAKDVFNDMASKLIDLDSKIEENDHAKDAISNFFNIRSLVNGISTILNNIPQLSSNIQDKLAKQIILITREFTNIINYFFILKNTKLDNSGREETEIIFDNKNLLIVGMNCIRQRLKEAIDLLNNNN